MNGHVATETASPTEASRSERKRRSVRDSHCSCTNQYTHTKTHTHTVAERVSEVRANSEHPSPAQFLSDHPRDQDHFS